MKIRLMCLALALTAVACGGSPTEPEERVPTTIDVEIVEPQPDSVCSAWRFQAGSPRAVCLHWKKKP